MAKFKDFNFKLAVIQELMYNQEVLTPMFDVYEFAEKFKERAIDVEKEGHRIIPEVKSYFKNLEISDELLSNIEELYQDGGDDIYLQLCPYWDGEDDKFNIQSAEDAKLLPNLKTVTLFYDDDDTVIEEFREMDIDAEYL